MLTLAFHLQHHSKCRDHKCYIYSCALSLSAVSAGPSGEWMKYNAPEVLVTAELLSQKVNNSRSPPALLQLTKRHGCKTMAIAARCIIFRLKGNIKHGWSLHPQHFWNILHFLITEKLFYDAVQQSLHYLRKHNAISPNSSICIFARRWYLEKALCSCCGKQI